MIYTEQDKIRLAKKVCKKLSNKKDSFEIESGFKDWISGVGMSIITLFSGIGNASATAKDVHNYINDAENKIYKILEKEDNSPSSKLSGYSLRKHFKVKNTFKPTGKGGVGQFSIKLGPYELAGDYYEVPTGKGGTDIEFKSKIFSEKPSPYEERVWGGIAEHLQKEIYQSFNKK